MGLMQAELNALRHRLWVLEAEAFSRKEMLASSRAEAERWRAKCTTMEAEAAAAMEAHSRAAAAPVSASGLAKDVECALRTELRDAVREASEELARSAEATGAADRCREAELAALAGAALAERRLGEQEAALESAGRLEAAASAGRAAIE